MCNLSVLSPPPPIFPVFPVFIASLHPSKECACSENLILSFGLRYNECACVGYFCK